MAQTITGNESSLSGRMHALLNAQATRVKLYKEFNDAFQDYLDGQCSAEQYHSICGVVTKGFQDVSTEIQAIEREMVEEYDRTDIANMIRQLQNKEKEKLHETVHVQIFTIRSREEEKDYDATVQERRIRLENIVQDINEIWDEIRQEATELSFVP